MVRSTGEWPQWKMQFVRAISRAGSYPIERHGVYLMWPGSFCRDSGNPEPGNPVCCQCGRGMERQLPPLRSIGTRGYITNAKKTHERKPYAENSPAQAIPEGSHSFVHVDRGFSVLALQNLACLPMLGQFIYDQLAFNKHVQREWFVGVSVRHREFSKHWQSGGRSKDIRTWMLPLPHVHGRMVWERSEGQGYLLPGSISGSEQWTVAIRSWPITWGL